MKKRKKNKAPPKKNFPPADKTHPEYLRGRKDFKILAGLGFGKRFIEQIRVNNWYTRKEPVAKGDSRYNWYMYCEGFNDRMEKGYAKAKVVAERNRKNRR